MNSPIEQLESLDKTGYSHTFTCIPSQAGRTVRERGKRLVGVCIFALTLLWCLSVDAPADARVDACWKHVYGASSLRVRAPMIDSNGVRYYPIDSAYQGSKLQVVRVLEPTHPAPGKPRRFLYILPVDIGVARLSSTWGDGLEELRLLDVPNRFNMTLIAPSFPYEPWYGDSDRDQAHRMESFVVDDLVPFGDTFAHGIAPQRLLIGFSKSGNGGLSLILRHPEVFQAAAAWDCPAQLSALSSFSALTANFGTQKNFDHYNIPALVANSGDVFRRRSRLWISGDPSVFTPDMVQLHNELMAASIPHIWVQGVPRAHTWHSGWLNGAVIGLDAMTAKSDIRRVLPERDESQVTTTVGDGSNGARLSRR